MVVLYLPNIGMGNQMFMYGTALALAKREHQKILLLVGGGKRVDRPFCLPLFSLNPRDMVGTLILKNANNSKRKKNIAWLIRGIVKRGFSGCVRLDNRDRARIYVDFPQGKRAYYLRGYFESFHYIDPVLPALKEQYQPKFPVSAKTQALWDRIQNDPHAVSLHIRMGDFVPRNRNYPLSYYENSILYHKKRDPDAHFYLLTEDSSVRQYFEGQDSIIPIDLSGEEHRDIVEWNCLKQCTHHILSSSTYSWWAAVLSETEESIISIPSLELYHTYDRQKGDSTIRYQNFYRPGWHPVPAYDAAGDRMEQQVNDPDFSRGREDLND